MPANTASTASTAIEILENKFGYHQFRERQAEIIADVLNNKDCFVLMPTGGVNRYVIKSLLY